MRLKNTTTESHIEMCQHLRLLGHEGYGVTELRLFEPRPMVAYAENEEHIVQLCEDVDGQTPGIYVGVQPRPLELFDKAPSCWKPSLAAPNSNCACDRHIEYITACFFDIDVVSEERTCGHPASEEELQHSLYAATLLSRESGLALSSTVCCSGNGHYTLAPIVPVPVDDDDVPCKFRYFCQQLARKIAGQVSGVKTDPVYNLSRVMRLMGTLNGKGHAVLGRAHRQAHFVTDPTPAKSMALHHMILNTETAASTREKELDSSNIKCDLRKIETCEFIKWCRKHPLSVSEPQWFAMITNLARLKGGPELIHDISRSDMFRYDYQQTQRLIERVLNRGYSPVGCEKLRAYGFHCPKLKHCDVRAPMYLTDSFSIWKR